jgi:putative FmdB family regulatory protein
MPIYEYQAVEPDNGCDFCRKSFELLRKVSDPPLEDCPECGSPLQKIVSSHSVGGSKTGLDDRAKSAGFHKLQRTGKGEYEKKY